MNSSSRKPAATSASEGAERMTDGYSSSAASVSPIQRKLVGMMLEVIDVLRDSCNDQELPAQTMALLLHVAHRSDPAGILELGEMTGMSRASASRLVQILGRGMRDRAGLDLIETYEDPSNWSRKLVRLTPKGARLIELLELKMMSIINRINNQESKQ